MPLNESLINKASITATFLTAGPIYGVESVAQSTLQPFYDSSAPIPLKVFVALVEVFGPAALGIMAGLFMGRHSEDYRPLEKSSQLPEESSHSPSRR